MSPFDFEEKLMITPSLLSPQPLAPFRNRTQFEGFHTLYPALDPPSTKDVAEGRGVVAREITRIICVNPGSVNPLRTARL